MTCLIVRIARLSTQFTIAPASSRTIPPASRLINRYIRHCLLSTCANLIQPPLNYCRTTLSRKIALRHYTSSTTMAVDENESAPSIEPTQVGDYTSNAAPSSEVDQLPEDNKLTAGKNEADQNNRKRGQTCKDRKEHAKRIREERGKEYANKQPNERRERPENSEPRLPKRKVALMMGFCGTGYQGMQSNPNARTIEGDLFKALVSAGAVSADNADDQKKVQFQRAARTDKGVHAAGQVVSLKMIIENPEVVDVINQNLPEQIRVWGYVRVIRSFNAKVMCDSRVYEYLLPTYVFSEPSEANAEIAKTVDYLEREIPKASEEEMKKKREYRIPGDVLEKVREAFGKYKGTHDFRNFTVTRGCTESNSKRFIHYFTVSDPMMINGTEWLSLKVKGQSFMLHQIRKMVGLIILIVRSKTTPLSLIDEIFGGPKINVPKAPGLGLLLERPVFDAFSKRVAEKKQEYADPISFDPYQEQIAKFKQEFIYDRIFAEEVADGVFDTWVQSIEVFPEQYTYINDEGTIPDSAIIAVGEDTNFPFPAGANRKNPAASLSDGDISENEN